jgi:hypothetical protein
MVVLDAVPMALSSNQGTIVICNKKQISDSLLVGGKCQQRPWIGFWLRLLGF